MTPSDMKLIESFRKKIDNNLKITVALGNANAYYTESKSLQEFCTRLAELLPGIKINKDIDQRSSPPMIKISPNISYQAVPTGQELELFLKALTDSDSMARRLPAAVHPLLEKITAPAMIKIYITALCPFCPTVVAQFLALAAAAGYIRLTIIDGTLFTETALANRIKSAPTVLLDDQFRWSGAVDLKEIVEMILNRDPSQLSAASLRGMFEEGKAAEVARLMLDNNKIFPGFLELLYHEKWPVRLAAMVAFEIIADTDKQLAVQVIGPLWKQFAKASDQVKGDIVYILGEAGDSGAAPYLKAVADGPYNAEIKEAATEALDKLI